MAQAHRLGLRRQRRDHLRRQPDVSPMVKDAGGSGVASKKHAARDPRAPSRSL
jgi:hypothetical protein